MKKIVSIISIILTIFALVILGLYTYESAAIIFFNTILISTLIGFKKKSIIIQTLILVELILFEILLLIGIGEINLPIEEQSFILGIFMSIFIITHIFVTIFGIFILIRGRNTA